MTGTPARHPREAEGDAANEEEGAGPDDDLTGRPALPEPPDREAPAAAAGGEHREHDALPCQPLLSSLVARVVKPKAAEAQCPGADAAMKKELRNMNSKKVWDVDDVYSLEDWQRDTHISEAMLGRAFAILGIKGKELGRGSNIRTKTGTSAADFFEEASNAPASFAAARAALSVAALKGFNAFYSEMPKLRTSKLS